MICGKKFKFKIVKVMKFTFKTIYSHFLSSITSNDTFSRSHLGILHLKTQYNDREHHENVLKFEQHFAITIRRLTKTCMVLGPGHLFWATFHACTRLQELAPQIFQ